MKNHIKKTYFKYIMAVVAIMPFFTIMYNGCNKSSSSEEKRIFVGAGAGLKPALDPIAKLFFEKTGIKVDHSYLCSAMVLSNMQLTRSGDILIPGSQHYMDIAIKKQIVNPDTVDVAGYMIPVIVVQKGNPKNITCIEDLAKPGLKVGVGEPEAVAVGKLTKKMLVSLGLYDSVMKNVVLTAGSATKLILPAVMGNVDAVINWRAVAKNFEAKIDIIKIKPEKVKYTVAPIGITKYSKKIEYAKKYVDFISSKEGRDIFEKYGYNLYFDIKKEKNVR